MKPRTQVFDEPRSDEEISEGLARSARRALDKPKPPAPAKRPMLREHLRTCEACNAPHPGGLLYRVRIELGVLDPRAINTRLGMMTTLGNAPGSEAIAEALTGGPVGEWGTLLEVTLCVACGAHVAAAAADGPEQVRG